MVRLQAFDSSYFRGKNHFEDDGTQDYLVFQPICRYFKKIGNSVYTSAWKYKGLYDENIKPPATSDNSLALALNYIGVRPRIKCAGHCLKQDKVTFTHNNVVSINTAYEINL